MFWHLRGHVRLIWFTENPRNPNIRPMSSTPCTFIEASLLSRLPFAFLLHFLSTMWWEMNINFYIYSKCGQLGLCASKQSLAVFCHRFKNQPSALVSASASLASRDTLVNVCVHARAHTCGRRNYDLKGKQTVEESNSTVPASI